MGEGSLEDGLENLRCHIENLNKLNVNLIVTLNKFNVIMPFTGKLQSNKFRLLTCIERSYR